MFLRRRAALLLVSLQLSSHIEAGADQTHGRGLKSVELSSRPLSQGVCATVRTTFVYLFEKNVKIPEQHSLRSRLRCHGTCVYLHFLLPEQVQKLRGQKKVFSDSFDGLTLNNAAAAAGAKIPSWHVYFLPSR